MWSTTNTIPSMENKSTELKKVFADAANAAIKRGQTTEESVFAGISAVKLKERNTKPIVKTYEPPSHIKALIDKANNPTVVDEEIESASRELIGAKFDSIGRLILTFDDGQYLVTEPVPVSSTIESRVAIVEKSSDTLKDEFETTGETNPVYSYASGNLSRIDYASGNYKLFTYSSGVLTQVDYVKATNTYRKVLSYNPDGSLANIQYLTL